MVAITFFGVTCPVKHLRLSHLFCVHITPSAGTLYMFTFGFWNNFGKITASFSAGNRLELAKCCYSHIPGLQVL